MKDKAQKKSEKAKKNRKVYTNPNNKKHRNKKNLKARYILEREKAKNNNEIEAQSSSGASGKRILHIIKNIVLGIVIAALAVAIISFIVIKFNGGTPSVFGYSVQRISSGSMEPELNIGDIILSKSVSEPGELQLNDIITFKGGDKFDNRFITHRVISVPTQDSDGEYLLITKGDANEDSDGLISFSSVKSKVIKKLEVLNGFYDFFTSPWGLVVFIGALLIVFFDELMTLVKVLTGNYNEEDDESEDESIGEIMKRLKKEEVEAFLEHSQAEEKAKIKKAKKRNNTSKKKLKNRSEKNKKVSDDPTKTTAKKGNVKPDKNNKRRKKK